MDTNSLQTDENILENKSRYKILQVYLYEMII